MAITTRMLQKDIEKAISRKVSFNQIRTIADIFCISPVLFGKKEVPAWQNHQVREIIDFLKYCREKQVDLDQINPFTPQIIQSYSDQKKAAHERDKLVRGIEGLYPPDDSEEGQRLLLQAINSNWRTLPIEILRTLSSLCEWRDNNPRPKKGHNDIDL